MNTGPTAVYFGREVGDKIVLLFVLEPGDTAPRPAGPFTVHSRDGSGVVRLNESCLGCEGKDGPQSSRSRFDLSAQSARIVPEPARYRHGKTETRVETTAESTIEERDGHHVQEGDHGPGHQALRRLRRPGHEAGSRK